MNDKEAYEISLIENIQRKTFDPVEEAKAFKRYVDEFGYGSTSELALRIGKSEEYVSHRIGLLSLPGEVLQKVSRRQLTPSHAQELRGLNEEDSLRISEIVVESRISAKQVRNIVKRTKTEGRDLSSFDSFFSEPLPIDETERRLYQIDRKFGKCIAALKAMMIRFDEVIDTLDEENEWAIRQLLLEDRNLLHQHIDNMMRMKQKTRRTLTKTAR
jgi:ParB family chromosome partitioning protein